MDYSSIYNLIFKNKSYNDKNSISYKKALEYIHNLNNIYTITNIGSGKGNLERLLLCNKNFNITSCDLENFLDNDVLPHNFVKIDLSNPECINNLPTTDVLFCMDVLEHIEEKYVDNILKNFSKISKYVFLTIANHSDIIENIELHLIQKPLEFWSSLINKYFIVDLVEQHYNNRLFVFNLRSK